MQPCAAVLGNYSCARLHPLSIQPGTHERCAARYSLLELLMVAFQIVHILTECECVQCSTKIMGQGNAPHVLSVRSASVPSRNDGSHLAPASFLYSPFPHSYTTHPAPPSRRHHLHTDSPSSTAPTIPGKCAHTLFNWILIARAHILAEAVACRIRRSHACRYLPTIAYASPPKYPSNGRCTSQTILNVVTKSISRIYGKIVRSIWPGDGRFHASGRATDRCNDNDVPSRYGRRHV